MRLSKKLHKNRTRKCLTIFILLLCLFFIFVGLNELNKYCETLLSDSNLSVKKIINMPEADLQNKNVEELNNKTSVFEGFDGNIRVLIKNSAYKSIYHDEVIFTSDGNFTVEYDTLMGRCVDTHSGDELISFFAEDDYSDIGKITINANENPIIFCNLKRNFSMDGNKGVEYHGKIDLYYTEYGFVVVNELNIEDYIKGVVPSEMPCSYPLEALKSQAICARTYVMYFKDRMAYPEFCAWLDDSTSFQVYNNLCGNENSDRAVEETAFEILTDPMDGGAARIFYFSTSPGKYDEKKYKSFEAFISCDNESDIEVNESWYRWSATEVSLNSTEICKRMNERQRDNPSGFFSSVNNEFVQSNKISFNCIKDMAVVKRGSNGVCEELNIWTDSGTYKVCSEYNIRYVLGSENIIYSRKDDDYASNMSILPSGFFILNTGKEGDNVISYSLIGGGFGHGNGLSQNGAKCLAEEGFAAKYILEYYFPDFIITHFTYNKEDL